jgi:dihydrofolate synthase/folylpolyglutamate synthase
MSVLADKDYRAMVRAVSGLGAAWVCVTSPNAARALSGEGLALAIREEVRAAGVPIEVAPDFSRAMERARQLAGPSGVVCAFGSLYSVAEIRKAL